MACGHLHVAPILARNVSSPLSEKIPSTGFPDTEMTRTKGALSWKRLQQRDNIALERDAVTKRRRDASKLHRLAAVHAIGNEILIGRVGDGRSRRGELGASAAAANQKAASARLPQGRATRSSRWQSVNSRWVTSSR
jgi:hypothetical protein